MNTYKLLSRSVLGLAICATLPACQVTIDNNSQTPGGTGSNVPGATGNMGTGTGGVASTGTANTNGATATTTTATTTTTGDATTGTAQTTGSASTTGASSEAGESDNGNEDGTGTDKEDPYLWLEEIESEAALKWVKTQNEGTKPRLEGVAGFEKVRKDIASILDSDERIPHIVKLGNYVYNFWRDADNVRGIWRRTTLRSYRRSNTRWTTVLDLDKLAEDEGENWVWGGATCTYPEADRCLIKLSRGGKDAKVVREFNTRTRKFVKDGFELPESKTSIDWQDKDHILVSTDFGEGSLTDSGYPRTTRRWARGTELKDAKEIYAGDKSDVLVYAFQSESKGIKRNLVRVRKTFYTAENYRINANDSLSKYAIPDTASMGFWGPWMSLNLKEDWTVDGKTYKQGTFMVIDEIAFLSGNRDFDVLFAPDAKSSLVSVVGTKDYLLVSQTRDVKGRMVEWKYSTTNAKWEEREVELPGAGGVSVRAYDSDNSNDYFLTYQDHITPQTLFLGNAGEDKREVLRAMPEFFDAKNLEVNQYFATSKDGTKVPYFQISRKGLELNGKNPTIMYGYGGFEISLKPGYSASVGKTWLEKGGVYVVANIRGGGEYGPSWHRAALKEKRQKAFDDFIAIGEHLNARSVTSPAHLGIRGGSNGGLLTGAVLVQRPELWGAVVSEVPLLDMKRFNKLLAGASWVAEYGNPDLPAEWDFISKYSPYHNVKAGVNYPPFFLTTSTKDDRVHPAHARKMMMKMSTQGHDKLYYYENIEGGHGGAANNEQRSNKEAMIYAFFADKLGLKLDK